MSYQLKDMIISYSYKLQFKSCNRELLPSQISKTFSWPSDKKNCKIDFGFLRTFYQGYRIGDLWKALEKKFHTNVLKLRAIKYAILTFTFLLQAAHKVHIQIDNIVAVSYLVKMGYPQQITYKI